MPKLPLNCEATYHPTILTPDEGNALFDELVADTDILNRTIQMADGSEVEGGLGAFMFADETLTSFDKLPEAWGSRSTWSKSMLDLKNRVEQITGQQFHLCRCLYYPDGNAGVPFHSDPPAYGSTTWIASISLGAEREFELRNKEDHADQLSIVLEHGSLIVMGEHCQDRYEHAIPYRPGLAEPRINLTFRKFGWD